jgi:predicted NBD/HSP70 family sugar kinase
MADTPAQTVLRALLDAGESTAPELAVRLGLSKPTVATALKRLAEQELVANLGIRSGALGRSPALWGIDAKAAHVVGVDLGTRVVQAAVADLGGVVTARHIEPLEGTSPTAIASSVERTLSSLLQNAGVDDETVTAVVVGVPGAVDPLSGHVRLAANVPGLAEDAAIEPLRRRFPGRVGLVKDIYLAAHGEMEVRGEPGADFALVTVGRGVSAAIVRDGHLVTGSRGFSGEIGYLSLNPFDEATGGAPLEEAASSENLLREAGARGLEVGSVGELADAARRGAGVAGDVLHAEAALVAHALATLAITTDPAVFVLTGSIPLAVGDRFAALVSERLTRLLPFAAPDVEIAQAGREATVSGAIALAVTRSWDAIVESLRVPGTAAET